MVLDQIISVFFVAENTVTGIKIYFNMPDHFAFFQLDHLHLSIIFQQVLYLTGEFTGLRKLMWFYFASRLGVMVQRHGRLVHQTLLPLTFLWGFIKEKIYSTKVNIDSPNYSCNFIANHCGSTEHLILTWLSPRNSPRRQRIACWRVLIFCIKCL